MPLPRAVPVALTAAERTTLRNRARGAKTAYRDRLRGADRAGGRADRRGPADLRGYRAQVAGPVRRPIPGRLMTQTNLPSYPLRHAK
jgi:hypothetical protein